MKVSIYSQLAKAQHKVDVHQMSPNEYSAESRLYSSHEENHQMVGMEGLKG